MTSIAYKGLLAGVAGVAIAATAMPEPASAQSLGDIRQRAERAAGERTSQARERRTPQTGNTRADRDAAGDIEATLDEILHFTLDIGVLARAEDGAWELAQQQVQAFRSEMATKLTDDVVSRANDTSGRATARLLQEAERSAQSMETRIGRTNVEGTMDDTRKGTMFAKYGVPLSMRERLIQLQRLYPQSTAIRKANQTATGVLAQLGTFDEVEARADANYAALVASTQMYDAVKSDPALERNFVSAYWASPFSRDFAGGKVEKIHLTSRAWNVELNALGRPVSRDQGASLAISAPDGKCYMVQGLFEQKYAGSGYGATYYRSGDTQEMLCENIP